MKKLATLTFAVALTLHNYGNGSGNRESGYGQRLGVGHHVCGTG